MIKQIDFGSKSVETKLYGMLLRMPLFGVLDFSNSSKVQDIEFYIRHYIHDDLLLGDGFYISYEHKAKKVRKYPVYFKGEIASSKFFNEYNIKFNDTDKYYELMKIIIRKYNKTYNAFTIQKKTNKEKRT